MGTNCKQNPTSFRKQFDHLCFITNLQILKRENRISFKVLRFLQKPDFVVYSVLCGIPPFPSATFCPSSPVGTLCNTSSHKSFTNTITKTHFPTNTHTNTDVLSFLNVTLHRTPYFSKFINKNSIQIQRVQSIKVEYLCWLQNCCLKAITLKFHSKIKQVRT